MLLIWLAHLITILLFFFHLSRLDTSPNPTCENLLSTCASQQSSVNCIPLYVWCFSYSRPGLKDFSLSLTKFKSLKITVSVCICIKWNFSTIRVDSTFKLIIYETLTSKQLVEYTTNTTHVVTSCWVHHEHHTCCNQLLSAQLKWLYSFTYVF